MMIDLLQLGVANGLGQEQGVERQVEAPPGTYDVRQCAMRSQWWLLGSKDDLERCTNSPLAGSDFCEEHVSVRLCKTSGLQFQCEGNRDFISLDTMLPHGVNDFWTDIPPTKRKHFCSDRCRNLWRDTQKRRNREAALAVGNVPAGYRVICNYRNTGSTVLMNETTGSICNTTRFTF